MKRPDLKHWGETMIDTDDFSAGLRRASASLDEVNKALRIMVNAASTTEQRIKTFSVAAKYYKHMSKGKILILRVKKEYWDAIKAGTKTEEFREVKPYWATRLVGKRFEGIHIINGYPGPQEAEAKTLIRPWLGFSQGKITHKQFGDCPTEVFKIKVN